MEYIDWMWVKFWAVVVIAFGVGFWRAVTGREDQ